MRIHFHKYQATGNDFVLIDNRTHKQQFSSENIKNICDRRFGIGADGLILIEETEEADFKMIYFNSDGTQSLCGNGCRSAVDFASSLKMIHSSTSFLAYDGLHEASIVDNNNICLKMNKVEEIKVFGSDFFINTGSPHYIRFVDELDQTDVLKEGRAIRNRNEFKPGGTNVNFVKLLPNNSLAVRTYERGVEDETLSCGTGVTAAALAAHYKGYQSPVNIKVLGGELAVEFEFGQKTHLTSKVVSDTFDNIFLIGPAKMVFEGDLEL